MEDIKTDRPNVVTGPLGEPMSRDTLPPANTRRWVVRRKAEVVSAVNGGLLTIAEACERYDLTLEELASWQRSIEREGMAGLRATRVQHYRQVHERRGRFS
ncbi:CtrA inhibitor SciP [Novosphingobium gossypii]|uniref:CtrA inhibitor SciP n=1 Tax=Novosphingobium gossypii TaxID=1604774 RepID=UPI003D1C3F24